MPHCREFLDTFYANPELQQALKSVLRIDDLHDAYLAAAAERSRCR